jgi:hypothetical protein
VEYTFTINTGDTVVFLQQYLSWFNNAIGLVAAYCLSNRRVTIGRIFGVMAAVFWMVYGYITSQYAFIVADCIFLLIYTQAIIKFNSKKDEYKERESLKEDEMVDLHAVLDEIMVMQDQMQEYRKIRTEAANSQIKYLQVQTHTLIEMYAKKQEKSSG